MHTLEKPLSEGCKSHISSVKFWPPGPRGTALLALTTITLSRHTDIRLPAHGKERHVDRGTHQPPRMS